MVNIIVKRHVARHSRMPIGPSCPRWQDLMRWVAEKQEARKALIKEASVYYPAALGDTGDLPPRTNISHHFTPARVRAAIKLLKTDTAPGIDNISVEDYTQHADVEALVRRVRSGKYRPGPLRRAKRRKPDGTYRLLGIPRVEDRAVQRTWLLIIEQLFERMFLPCSYGYRPDRNAHQALEAIATEIEDRGNLWVLDADFSKFFDSVSHRRLKSILRRTIADPVFLRFCERTLRADVIEGKVRTPVRRGTPQGGVISPLLANLYAHWVLDVFFEEVVRPRLHGWARLFRYADDFIVLTESKEDAELALAMIDARVTEWGLKLHPMKTSVHNLSCPGLQPLREDEAPRELLFLGYQIHWLHKGTAGWEVRGRTAPGRVEKALERWQEHLDELKENLGAHGCRRYLRATLAEKLISMIWNHVKGLGGFYRAEGNEPEIHRYEEAVFRGAAAFWRRHIDAVGHNPFEEPTDRIWATIRMRPMRELSE